MLYWGLLLVLLITVGTSRLKFKTSIREKTKDGRKIYITFAGILFVVFASLRSIDVGRDTSMYYRLFGYMQSMSSLKEAFSSWMLGGVEPGYAVMEYFFAKYSNFQMMLFVAALFSIVPTMVVIYKYSTDYYMSLFLYIAFGFFSFAMNPIRQAIAIGICMIAFIFAKEKKLLPYLGMIVLACLFHTSAIVFLPTYWLSKIKYNKKTLVVYVMLLAIANLFKGQFFRFINLFSRQEYTSTGDAGGTRMYLFMLASMLLMIIYHNKFIEKDKETNTQLMCMFAISTLIWPIASANAAVFRLYYYYQIFMVFCIPSFIASLGRKVEKLAFKTFFVVIGCYFLQAYIINGALKYSPYTSFWQIS